MTNHGCNLPAGSDMDGRTPSPSSTKPGVNWKNLVHDRIFDFCLDKGDIIFRRQRYLFSLRVNIIY
jgi:hypothetical protein